VTVQTSENGITFIKVNEGLTLSLSLDVGHPEIGYGHDLTQQECEDGTYANGISADQADLLLRRDLSSRFEPVLNRLLPPTVTQNQFDACADFIYNDGPVAFATLIHHGLDQFPIQAPAWHWTHVNGVLVSSPGLVARRAKEVALFNS
jgi:lysozyme